MTKNTTRCPKCKASYNPKWELEQFGCWQCGYKPNVNKHPTKVTKQREDVNKDTRNVNKNVNTPNRQSEWESNWQEIANILSHGFYDVHVGETVPIDVIERVQEVYHKTLASYRQKLKGEVESMKIGFLPAPLTKAKIIAGIKIQAHDKAIQDVIKLLGGEI